MELSRDPTLQVEAALLAAGHCRVAGVDEVGRGALAGPVTVGVVVLDVSAVAAGVPTGLRDSKLLSASSRDQLAPVVAAWAVDWSVGHARADEVDRLGLTCALGIAAGRALAGLSSRPQAIILDGRQDWLTPAVPVPRGWSVSPLVRADRRCAAVAAASVLAKTTRDRLMSALAQEYPAYGWADNKGYGTAAHRAALRLRGPCAEHRRSWRLPSLVVTPDAGGARE
ncbi:MAG: ribonuclease HII [Actinomycetes bacterium]